MDLPEFMRVLRKNWLTIAILGVLGGVLGYTYSALATPEYATTAQVFVSTAGAQDAQDLATGNTFTQQRVTTYAGLVRTVAVLTPVIDELNLDVDVETIREDVSADAPANTTAIEVTATSSDPVAASLLATAVSRSLINTVEAIETTDPIAGSPVRLTLVQPASVPKEPVSPKKSLNIALGLIAGIAIGVAFAVVRSTMDTRVRNERDVKRITEAPILGGIVFDPVAQKRPLVIHEEATGVRAESFRTLRTNLQFLEADHSGTGYVITSSIAAEGKSTTAANLAITLAEAGGKVLLVGADLRRPRMERHMGLEAGVGLTDVLIGRVELEDAIHQWGPHELYVLPSGSIPPNPSELLGSELMQTLVTRLDEEYDAVIYDAPPLLPVTDAAVLARRVGGTLLVVAAGTAHRHQVESSITALTTAGAQLSGLVLTMLPASGPDSYGYGLYRYEAHDARIEPAPRPPLRTRISTAMAALRKPKPIEPDSLGGGAAGAGAGVGAGAGAEQLALPPAESERETDAEAAATETDHTAQETTETEPEAHEEPASDEAETVGDAEDSAEPEAPEADAADDAAEDHAAEHSDDGEHSGDVEREGSSDADEQPEASEPEPQEYRPADAKAQDRGKHESAARTARKARAPRKRPPRRRPVSRGVPHPPTDSEPDPDTELQLDLDGEIPELQPDDVEESFEDTHTTDELSDAPELEPEDAEDTVGQAADDSKESEDSEGPEDSEATDGSDDADTDLEELDELEDFDEAEILDEVEEREPEPARD